MAMAEQQWSNNWNCIRSEHAVSNPIMVPHGSPRSVGEQSGIFHQMVENVLNSPGSINNRGGDLKFNLVDQRKHLAGVPHGTPPTNQMYSSSPPLYAPQIGYHAAPPGACVPNLTNALSQMHVGSPHHEFNAAGPPQLNGQHMRAFAPQMPSGGYYIVGGPTSPPVSIASSPIYRAGLYPNAPLPANPVGTHVAAPQNGPSNAVYGPMPPQHWQIFNGAAASVQPHFSHAPTALPPHIDMTQQLTQQQQQQPHPGRRNVGQLTHTIGGVGGNGGGNGASTARTPHLTHVLASGDSDKSASRSQLLEDFRNSRLPQLQLSDLGSFVVEFAKDQHGSRFIQQKLERASLRDKQLVFDEVIANSSTLMTDVFGNYVVQKFLEHGSPEQRHQLIGAIKGNVMKLALQMYGCRVIQKALEAVSPEVQLELLKEIEPDVLKCVKDQNGNHVIQKVIERVPSNKLDFIINSFTADGQSTITTLSTHPYGCRVIQRVLEHCTDEQKRPILEQLHTNIRTLIVDQYGNYVVQHVIERGSDEDRDRIIAQIKGDVLRFAQHKFSSNVIEKCLVFGNNSHKTALITEVCGDGTVTPLLDMMKDQFANYVVQKMLDVADSSNRKKIMLAIKPHIPTLRKFAYGKHIITKLEKYFRKF